MPTPISLQITYDSLRQHVAQLMGMSREPADWLIAEGSDVDRCIESGLRRFYGDNHDWSFFRIPYAFTTPAAYATGTITVVNGTATLAGGTWPTWAANGWIEFAGVSYEVASRTSGAIIVLVDTEVDAAALTTFNLVQTKYELPADFESAEGPITYHPESSLYALPLTDVGFTRVRMWYSMQGFSSIASTAEPAIYCIYPKTFDPEVGQRYYIELAPPPNEAHRLTIVYRSFGSALDETNIYPLGGPAHSETILAAVLAETERRTFGSSGEHEGRYQEALAKSIIRDRKTTNAEYLGRIKNPGYDGEEICDWPAARREPIFYQGNDLTL